MNPEQARQIVDQKFSPIRQAVFEAAFAAAAILDPADWDVFSDTIDRELQIGVAGKVVVEWAEEQIELAPARTRRELVEAAVESAQGRLHAIADAVGAAADAIDVDFEIRQRMGEIFRTELQVLVGAVLAGWEIDRLLQDAAGGPTE